MKGFASVALWLWLCIAAAAEEVKWVTFLCEPKDAQVLLEVGASEPYLLGRANEKLPLDLQLFDGRRQIRLTFRRAGWLSDTRILQQENISSRYFSTHDRYPDPQQGPVRLSPQDDLAGRLLQARYYFWQWRNLLAFSALMTLIIAVLIRHRLVRLKEGHKRGLELERLTACLDPSDSYSGRLLGRYRLLEKLGEGGMSSVYRAVDNDDLNSETAVKILDSELAQDATSVKRFQREIQICQSLSHPNILQLYDFGQQDGLFYLVMEKLVGRTLSTELDQGVFSPERVAELCSPVMEACQYLHQRDIIHRDIKPDNVFLTESGRVLLMDFGISRGKQFTVATATQAGLGTPSYMSPEQVEGAVHPATDQYAIGCMIYEMLSGAPPFTDPDPFALAFKHVGQKPDPLSQRAPEVSPQLEAVVMRLLEKDPERRYSSMSEAREALLDAC